MRTKNVTVRTPNALLEVLTLRAEQTGYPSLTAYFLGLARYDLMVQGAHEITQPWSELTLSKQDQIDDHLCRLFKHSKGERGQLLSRLIERAKAPTSGGIIEAMKEMDAPEEPKKKKPQP